MVSNDDFQSIFNVNIKNIDINANSFTLCKHYILTVMLPQFYVKITFLNKQNKNKIEFENIAVMYFYINITAYMVLIHQNNKISNLNFLNVKTTIMYN